MASIILHGIITPEGQLEVDLPADLTPGPVEVEIRQSALKGISLGDLLKSDLVGMWADRTDIEDSVEYARELRRRASRRNLE
jgi:hypothetical protein